MPRPLHTLHQGETQYENTELSLTSQQSPSLKYSHIMITQLLNKNIQINITKFRKKPTVFDFPILFEIPENSIHLITMSMVFTTTKILFCLKKKNRAADPNVPTVYPPPPPTNKCMCTCVLKISPHYNWSDSTDSKLCILKETQNITWSCIL